MATHLGVADRLVPLLERVVGDSLPIRARWDGSESVRPASTISYAPRVRCGVCSGSRRLGLGRAYVAVSWTWRETYEVLRFRAATGQTDGRHALSAADPNELIKTAVVLGAVGPQPKPPPEEAALSGRRHSRSRDRAAVRHHYDVGNDFYRIFLGPSLVYSCAYWTAPDDPTYTLEDAQRDKLDLICRKLELRPGMRLLDVGCGWGSLVIHAAREYGVSAVGVTLSGEQAALARARAAGAGLSKQVEIRVEDYRDVPDGPYDAIASIGMAEHVGAEKYSRYAATLYSLLKPAGRLLNHQIARRPGSRESGSTFITSYVFPDGELAPVGTTVSLLEEAGFEVRDVESLREHYEDAAPLGGLTWSHWDDAVRLASPGRARVAHHMAGSLAFGRLDRVNQSSRCARLPRAQRHAGHPSGLAGRCLYHR
jgi:cyclopropane-fatty-acyl-phospholipid synthase